VINCAVGYLCFRETVTPKMLLGMLVTLSGIISISLSKGGATSSDQESLEDETLFKIIAIVFAILIGVMNAL
jgi:drug/metabolite transporter (DMT)-like permease